MIIGLKGTRLLGRYCLNHDQDVIPKRRCYMSAPLSSFSSKFLLSQHTSLSQILSCSFGKPHLSPQEEIYPLDPFHYCVNLSESKEGHLKRASSAWSWQALNNGMGSLRFWGSVLVHTSHWNSPQINHG